MTPTRQNLNEIDCFSSFWIAFLPDKNIDLCINRFKQSILVTHGANPYILSAMDSNVTGIDQLLRRILKLPNNESNYAFKMEIIPFLIGLGAQIK